MSDIDYEIKYVSRVRRLEMVESKIEALEQIAKVLLWEQVEAMGGVPVLKHPNDWGDL